MPKKKREREREREKKNQVDKIKNLLCILKKVYLNFQLKNIKNKQYLFIFKPFFFHALTFSFLQMNQEKKEEEFNSNAMPQNERYHGYFYQDVISRKQLSL